MDQIVGEIRHAVAWLAKHLGNCDANPARGSPHQIADALNARGISTAQALRGLE
jgi:hypothetical protein